MNEASPSTSPSQSTGLTRTQWYVLAAAFLGWMFDGFEMGLYPLAARPALRDIMATMSAGGDRIFPAEEIVGNWYSWLVSLFLLGAACGGLVFGWMGDRLGRVRTMAMSIAAYAVFTGCVFFATEPWHLGAFRFLAALGMGGEWSLGVALVMEAWPEKLRPILAGVIGAAANFGFLLISLLGVLFIVDEDSWRWMMLAGAAPGLLAVFVIMFIPESERWKESVKAGRSKPIREIFGTRLVLPTMLGVCFAAVALTATWGAVSGFLPVWTDQLASGERTLHATMAISETAESGLTPDEIRNTENVSVEDTDSPGADYALSKRLTAEESVSPGQTFEYWLSVTNTGTDQASNVVVNEHVPLAAIDPSSVSLDAPAETTASFDPATGQISWKIGVLDNKDPRAKSWVQTLLSIGAILGCFIGPLLANWLGRRPAYFLLCLASLVSCGYLFLFLSAYNALFIAVVAVAGLVSASFYGWLPLYLPELFPTRVRATGQGVAFNFARILAAGGSATTGILIGVYGGSYAKACATVILVYLVGMVLIWLAPETKGKPLPE